MSQETDAEDNAGIAGNLIEFLNRLKSQGITQREVAGRAKVPVQYLSDVKNGSRNFTELFARRLAEEFGVDYRWLLGQSDSISPPRLSMKSADAADTVRLPVFGRPIEGDPKVHQSWDGATIDVAGAAAVRSRRATHPYILRLDSDDRHGRLCRNDLVLVSQQNGGRDDIHVIKSNGDLILARRTSTSAWEPIASGRKNRKLADSIGHVLGIVWGARC